MKKKDEEEKNPDYAEYGKHKKIATKCRLCGKQMLDPTEFRDEAHAECIKKYKRRSY